MVIIYTAQRPVFIRPGKLAALVRLHQQKALLEHSKLGSLYKKIDENVDLSEFFNGKKDGKKNEKKTAVHLKVKITKSSRIRGRRRFASGR